MSILMFSACAGDWVWPWVGPYWDVASFSFKSKCWLLQVGLHSLSLFGLISLTSNSCHLAYFVQIFVFECVIIEIFAQVVCCLWRRLDRLLRLPPCSLRWRWKPRGHHPGFRCHGPVAEVPLYILIFFIARLYNWSLIQGGLDRSQPGEQRFWQDVDHPWADPLCSDRLRSSGESKIGFKDLWHMAGPRWTRLTRSQPAGVSQFSSQLLSSECLGLSSRSPAATWTRRRRSSWLLPGSLRQLSR